MGTHVQAIEDLDMGDARDIRDSIAIILAPAIFYSDLRILLYTSFVTQNRSCL